MSTKGTLATWMASLAAVFMVVPNVSAEDVSYEVLLERIESLESQLTEQDTRFASYNLGGSEQKDDDCGSCQKGKGDCGCGPTWTFMAEVPWLQVHDGGLAIPGLPLLTPTYGQELGIRLLAAREWDNGLGFRFTGFHFDDSTGNGLIGPIGLGSSTEVYAVDFELTQRGRFCGWDLMATGGVRIGGIEQDLAVIVPGAGTLELAREFDGAGLTGGIEFNRAIGQTRLNAYGGMNFSLLFGDADINIGAAPAIPATVATLPNQTVAIWEMQLGVEYQRETRWGMGLARVGVEAQMWEQPPVLLGLGDDNVGFFGPTFALGLQR